MKVMVIVKASRSSEAGEMPDQELLTAMGAFNEELARAGVMLEGAGLKPSSAGVRISFSGTDRVVTDGPFTETKELIAGYWIWNVNSLEEAIAWARKCPNPMPEDSDIEIRPIFEIDDFGEALTPELREQEASIVARTLNLGPPRFETTLELLIAGFGQHYSMETRAVIPQHWERFISRISSVPRLLGGATYGVCWNAQPDCSFDYLTGVEFADNSAVPEDFSSVKTQAGRYAVFTHAGHVSAIPRTIDIIWTKWVPECGLQVANAPCFEKYTSEFNSQTGLGGMEIWIPLAAT